MAKQKEIALIFEDFMTRVLEFENMQKLGSQMLAGFQQDLDLFGRPPLHDTSNVVADLFARNPSVRATNYMEAGCRHSYMDKLVLSCPHYLYAAEIDKDELTVQVLVDTHFKKLHNHIMQVHENIVNLQSLVEKANNMMHEELSSMLEKANISEDAEIADSNDNSTEEFIGMKRNKTLRQPHDYVTMMALLLAMLEKEYEMQERIVTSLGLDTPEEVLQSYCLLWTLRPYVDEQVFESAVSWS